MPIIKPISDLRNKSLEISRLAHKLKEPIFITRNGEGDMVVMSIEYYDELYVYAKLMEAQASIAAGDKGRPMADVMRDARKRIHERSRKSGNMA